ncbi:hypothetical protein I79_000837 [Cricetulus griseus]|uniref:Uncharacterized protein n=1 Tax=Cricetulus griseus TaxID=10029 RepID=G3GT63_CRIGR|nr:hypothetical protein I79_000837 [Cricetulus griseus]
MRSSYLKQHPPYKIKQHSSPHSSMTEALGGRRGENSRFLSLWTRKRMSLDSSVRLSEAWEKLGNS